MQCGSALAAAIGASWLAKPADALRQVPRVWYRLPRADDQHYGIPGTKGLLDKTAVGCEVTFNRTEPML